MDKNVLSVSQVNKYIKMAFDKDTFLSRISIRGEITNFKSHYTGHLYFTLKDETSTIKCVMFKTYAENIKFKLNDGMKVVIDGTISIFERDGSYQLYCKNILPEGVGELYLAYEQLKNKLNSKGYFDDANKMRLPYIPKRVGVITSKTGSVIQDIINVTTRRYNKVDLLIYPAFVQGVNTASSVISGIELFNKLDDIDVIIIARGGGSFEDLYGFNDEDLAISIYNSKIPIISAVGHETDFTICDFVSDMRAPTPSVAAELVYPKTSDLIYILNNVRKKNSMSIKNYIDFKKEYIKRIKSYKLEKIPTEIISNSRLLIDKVINIFSNKSSYMLNDYKLKFNNCLDKLEALSPINTMKRGYSVVQGDNKLITSIKDIKVNDNLKVIVSDGSMSVLVEEISNEK